MTKIISVNVTPSNKWIPPAHAGPIATLPTFDNTKLVAINTCPLWGITRYTHHKIFSSGTGRAMALEAGSAAHEVFAAHRLYSLQEFGSEFYPERSAEDLRAAVERAGQRIFGPERFEEMVGAVDPREDFRTRLQQFAITAMYNCGFYDDPGDRKRTMTNIEEMCIAYMDKYSWHDKLPIWINDFVGVEIPVDVVIEIRYEDGDTVFTDGQGGIHRTETVIYIRFIGKVDGIHYANSSREEIRIHENKTASILGEAWELSWETNHQPTGYMIAISAMLSKLVSCTEIYGTCLPLPKSYSINGVTRVVADRKQWQFSEWLSWLLHTALLHEEFKNKPLEAPQYTHSCNRYFRPCSYIPLCATAPDERQEMFDEMPTQEWNPLHGQDGRLQDE